MAKLPDQVSMGVESMPCPHCGEVTAFGTVVLKLNWEADGNVTAQEARPSNGPTYRIVCPMCSTATSFPYPQQGTAKSWKCGSCGNNVTQVYP